jgi:type I restriction enzyme S subunit
MNAADFPSSDLPEGWTLVALGSVTSPSKERVEPSQCPNAAYLSLEHIEQNTGRIADKGRGADVGSTKAVFQAGDVLYGKLRPYLNKVCVPAFDGICSTDILVFGQRPHLESRYLQRFLMQRSVVDYAHHHSAGVQLPRVSFDKLAELEFPLPPLAEQKRIVAKVEQLLAKVDAARQRLAKAPALLKRFRQSVLAAACSGQLTAEWRGDDGESQPREIPSGWKATTVAAACVEVVDCPHSTPRWTSEGHFCVKTTQFSPGHLDLTSPFYVTTETYRDRTKRLKPQPGDVLYSREGSLGKACIVPPGIDLCLGQRIMLMRAAKHVAPTFLMHALNSECTLTQVRELTLGTTSPHVNVADVKRFNVMLPPLEEQREIVRRVEALFALADKIEARVQAATARVEKITQAILAKAFRGELVPTEAELARQEGREYEPASVLLERIRQQQESSRGGAEARRKSRQNRRG